MPDLRAGCGRAVAAASILFSVLLVAAPANAATTVHVCKTAGPGCDATSIQQGITMAVDGDTVSVGAGTFGEDVTVNKTIVLQGAGSDSAGTRIKGAIGGGSATIQIGAPGVLVDGFSITRFGNSVADWNDDLNSAGVAVQGQGNTVELRNSRLFGNRTGVDVNNSNGNSIHDNVIDDNRTGVFFRNQTDGSIVTGNQITNNWTVGVLFLDGSGNGTPPQSATGSTFASNNISGNWYGGIIDRQTGGTLPAPGTALKNFEHNWFGTNAPVFSSANSAEPGYAGQIPVEFGGTATNPGGAPDVAGPASANFDYSPFLWTGTDTSGATPGFQGDIGNLGVEPLGGSPAGGRLQDGADDVTSGGTVHALPGNYIEDVTVGKPETISGAGSGLGGSTVSGPIGGGGSTFTVAALNVVIEKFFITRIGNNTTDWNNPGLNSVGVSVQGLANRVELRQSKVSGNRTGVDINNSDESNIHDNVIDDNRTGMILRNQTDGTEASGNQITNNWTVGVLFLDGSGGSNSPVQRALASAFEGNDISGNWYGGIVDRQSGGSLPAPGTSEKNFSANWFGTKTPAVTTANTSEPGYATQIPVEFGGSATNPGGAKDIAGPASANFDYTPLLSSGTDTDSGALGFQGDTSDLLVHASGLQSGPGGRVQEGIDDLSTGGTVHVGAGTFAEAATVNKRLTLDGAGDTTVIDPPANGPALSVSSGGTQANPLVLSDLKTTGAAGGGNTGTGVALTAPVSDVTLQRVTSTGNTGNGFAVNASGAFNRLKLDDVDLSGNTTDGARFPTSMGKLDGLTITNSNLDNNGLAGMEIYGPGAIDPVTNVTITNSTFSNDTLKGIYAERLDHALLDGVTVNASGVTGASSAGIDLNLKKQLTFGSIEIRNSTISGSGTGDALNGVGLAIKSRDDGANGPTAVTGVNVNHNQITGNQRGIRLGEPTKNNVGPTAVTITRNNISGSIAEGAINITGTTADARCNYWGKVTGPNSAGTNSAGAGFNNLAAYLTTSDVNGLCAPTAGNDSATIDEDQVLTVAAPGLLSNDSDAESKPLTAVKIGNPAHGTAVVAANGSYVYTPEPNYNGPDSFTYAANNGTGNSNTATVSITVNPVDEPVGTPSGPSGPVGPGNTPGDITPDTLAPLFSSVKLTNKTFAVNTGGTAETPVAARARKGTKFVFTLSEASRVVFKFELKTKGRKVGSKCVKQTSKNKKGNKVCTRLVKFASFAVNGQKGANTKAFSGKIGKKTMKPGTYRATLTATDTAGNKSKAKLVNLKVVKK